MPPIEILLYLRKTNNSLARRSQVCSSGYINKENCMQTKGQMNAGEGVTSKLKAKRTNTNEIIDR